MLEHCRRPDWLYVYIVKLTQFMPYDDVANLVTVTKMNMINKIPCWYETLKTTPARIQHQVSPRAEQRSQLLWKSPPELCCGLTCSWSLLQTCTEVKVTPKLDNPISQISEHPECTSITAGAFWIIWEYSCRVWEHIAKLQEGLGASGSTGEHWWGRPERLKGLHVVSGPI